MDGTNKLLLVLAHHSFLFVKGSGDKILPQNNLINGGNVGEY